MPGNWVGGRADGRTGPKPVLLAKLIDAIHGIAGMPKYEAHVEHLRRCHPDQPLPTQRQFYENFVRARYGDGPTRCC